MYELNISSIDDVKKWMRDINVTATGIGLMSGKAVVRVVKVNRLDIRAANLLKQECLAIGADFSVPKEMCTLKNRNTDGILIANEKQLNFLINRLKLEPFGLKEFAIKLEALLKNSDRNFEFYCGKKLLKFNSPAVMGILNVTPDSFSDGGKFMNGKNDSRREKAAIGNNADKNGRGSFSSRINIDLIVKTAKQMAKDGANILDIGGESTGPGSKNVSIKDELERVIPVVKAVRKNFKGVISVDTYKSEVASEAIKAGADMINDVTAGRGDKKMFSVIAGAGAGYCMMYSKDKTARTTRRNVKYVDVVRRIFGFLEERMRLAMNLGIKRENLCIDPGMGAFVSGDAKYSLQLIKNLGAFRALGVPVLIGASRKGFISEVIGGDDGPLDRMEPSLIANVLAGLNGADILRVHDVKATVRGLKIAMGICDA